MLYVETQVAAPKFVPQKRHAFTSNVVLLTINPLFFTVKNSLSHGLKQGVNERRYSDDSFPCLNHQTGEERYNGNGWCKPPPQSLSDEI